MFDNQKKKQFFVFKNKKQGIFREYILIIFTCFLKIVLKNNYTNMKNG